MINRTYDIDIIPGAATPMINVSQYDDGLSEITFNLYANGIVYVPPTGSTATVQGTKPDNKGFSYTAAMTDSKVTFTITEQMTPIAGNVRCEIKIANSGEELHSAKFILVVDRAALGSDTDISKTDIPDIIAEASAQEEAAAASAAAAAASAEEAKSVSISVGTVTTGNAGTSAVITDTGTSPNHIFNFTIPKGDTGAQGTTGDAGAAATVNVGTTTTGAAGTSASVVNSGTTLAAVLNFTIPQGATGPQGIKGDTGDTGPKGDTGDTGATGPKGDAAATITVGSTTTGAAGTSASVTNSGTSSAVVLNFTIPTGAKGDTGTKGDAGDSSTVSVGTTTTGNAGTSASVTNSGTSSAAILNFTIPKGDTGASGAKGADGAAGADGTAATISVGTVATGDAGTSAAVTNSGTTSAAVFDFTIPQGATGPAYTLTTADKTEMEQAVYAMFTDADTTGY